MSCTAGFAGIEFRYVHMSRSSESEMILAVNVGMLLLAGCLTNAMNAFTAIGFGVILTPAPPCPSYYQLMDE